MNAGAAVSLVADEVAKGDSVKLVDIARERNISPNVPFRWATYGIPGAKGERVKLEAVLIGRNWFTSRAALARFFTALPQSVRASTSPQPNRSARASQRLKEKHGF